MRTTSLIPDQVHLQMSAALEENDRLTRMLRCCRSTQADDDVLNWLEQRIDESDRELRQLRFLLDLAEYPPEEPLDQAPAAAVSK